MMLLYVQIYEFFETLQKILFFYVLLLQIADDGGKE